MILKMVALVAFVSAALGLGGFAVCSMFIASPLVLLSLTIAVVVAGLCFWAMVEREEGVGP